VGGKQLQKCVKWLQLFVDMKLYTLHIFEWFKRLREGHEEIWKMMPGGWPSVAQNPETTVEVTHCWPETIK